MKIALAFEKNGSTVLFSLYDSSYFSIDNSNNTVTLSDRLYSLIDSEIEKTSQCSISDCTSSVLILPDDSSDKRDKYYCNDLKIEPLVFEKE